MGEIRTVGPDGKVIIPEEIMQEPADSFKDMAPDIIKPNNIDEIAVAQVLNLDEREREQYNEEIHTLIAWAKTQNKYDNPMELKWIIRELMTKLGTPNMNEKWITKASRYAYLNMEGRKIQQELVGLIR
jgi:hypothetical protein